MGKAQSKRSVDITTEGKKEEEVIAGKLEKIEDAEDQKPQVNGDATPPESDAKEKKESEESENDKDATTEKSSADAGGGGDQVVPQQNGEQNGEKEGENAAAAAATATTPQEETTKEGGDAAAAAEGAEEEISPLADDSSKKTKKEKVKKKWSFRNISFGKKDKQKPAKTDAEALSPTTNGETNDKPADGATTTDETKKEENGDAKAPTENGNASEKELLNGDGGDTTTTTTTPTEDKSATVATNNESTNETAAATAAATTNNTTASSSTTTSPSTAPVAAVTETENKIAVAANDVATPVLSNGNADDIKNVIDLDEKPKQNGTNGQEHAAEDDEEQTHAVDIKAVSKSIEYHNTISFDKKIPTIIEETVTNDGDGAGDHGAINKINSNSKAIVEEVGAGEDMGESKCEEVNVVEEKFVEPPPPLPISPPPSQMVAFALNPELAVPETVENWEKVETTMAPKISISDLENDLIEQNEINSSDNIENKVCIENIKNEIQAEEHVEKVQIETNDLHEEPCSATEIEVTEVQDVGIVDEKDPTVLAMTAAASIMVDEVTVKAAEIVTVMANVVEEVVESVFTESNYAENLVVVDEELPPPPPSPPSVQDYFEQCEDSGAVEDVLNQFESKMNEIEQGVMNCDTISVPENLTMSEQIPDDENKINNFIENIDDNLKECAELVEIEEQKNVELCETEITVPKTVEIEVNVPEKLETSINEHMKIEDNKPENVEIINSEHNDDFKDAVEQNGNETEESPVKDITEIEQSSNVNPEVIVSEEFEVIENVTTEEEQNGNETLETPDELGVKLIEEDTLEMERNGNESHKEENKNEMKNNEDEAIDATAIIVEQINKLSLNDKINSETTTENLKNNAGDDETSMKEGGKPQLIDFENVKEINPIELKEAAAAAEIKTQDLAVSCE